jgi:hypothetical protein
MSMMTDMDQAPPESVVAPPSWDISWPLPLPPEPPSAPPRRRRRWAVVAVVAALVASAAGVAGWSMRSSAPGHPSAWDPRVTDLVKFVEQERGLTYKHPVYVDFLTDAEFRKQVTSSDSDLSTSDRKQLEASTGMLRALGLIDGDVNLLNAMNTLQGEGVLAFYDPATQRVHVRGTDLTVNVRGTLVHELTHALQDQYFDLTREGSFPVDGQNDTYRPVFEGDAQHVEHAWVAQLSEADQAAYDRGQQAEGDSVNLDGVPDALVQFFAAPYNFGEPFVDALVAASGQKAVDDALRDPPKSDAELLDPFRYLNHEAMQDVAIPKLAAGEKKTDDGAFGAIALYLVLAQRMDPGRALAATDNWGGDAYVNYTRLGKGCVRADFTGKDAAATSALGDTLTGWAKSLPSGAATVTRQGDLIELNSCDPGASAAKSATGDLSTAVGVAVTRTQLAETFMDQRMTAAEAQCTSRHFLAAFSPAELTAFVNAQSEADLPPSIETKAASAAQACVGTR